MRRTVDPMEIRLPTTRHGGDQRRAVCAPESAATLPPCDDPLAMARGGRYGCRPMKLGVAIFPTDYSIRPDDFARACEERGFESVWFPEHTHIPASRATPYPAGGDLPKEYWHTHDPFVALMAAAAVTKTIKLAT